MVRFPLGSGARNGRGERASSAQLPPAAAFTIANGSQLDLPATRDKWTPGRQWVTNFGNQIADAALFTLTNMTYTTNGGLSCVKPTSSASPATVLLSGQQLQNCDVRIRYQVTDDATYHLANALIGTLARYITGAPASSGAYPAMGDCMFGMDDWWHGYVAVGSENAAVSGLVSANGTSYVSPPPLNRTDVTDHRYLRLRVIDDVLYLKNWFGTVAEPDAWNLVTRSRPSSSGAVGGVNLTTDDIQMGLTGLFAQYTTTYFYELVITELVNGSSNVVTNPTFTEVETGTPTVPAGCPIGWFYTGGAGTGGSIGVVQVPDRFGVTRGALQIVAGAGSTSPSWIQRIWNRGNRGGNASWPRLQPHPSMMFSPYIECRVWTKGTNIVNATPSNLNLATVVDNYYYDTLGNFPNTLALDALYFTALAPNTINMSQAALIANAGATNAPAAGVSVGGTGKWPWTQTVFRMPVHHWESISSIDYLIGFHDGGTTGTLQIMDPVLRPVY